eukprot:232537-Pyramimonas_sp.AAC.1
MPGSRSVGDAGVALHGVQALHEGPELLHPALLRRRLDDTVTFRQPESEDHCDHTAQQQPALPRRLRAGQSQPRLG